MMKNVSFSTEKKLKQKNFSRKKINEGFADLDFATTAITTTTTATTAITTTATATCAHKVS